MTHAELKAVIEDGRPLILHVADGRTYDVPHPDFIFLPPRSTVVTVATPAPDSPEEIVNRMIPLLMVSGISRAAERLP